MKAKKYYIVIFLTIDFVLLVLGFLNLQLYVDKADLSSEYQAVINDFSFDIKNNYKKEKIIEFDGKNIDRNGLVDFYLLNFRPNDTVTIKSVTSNGEIIERTVILPKKYIQMELVVMSIVTLFYFFTGIFVLLQYKNSSFSFIIHALAVSTGIMIILDWGNLITYGKLLNYVIFIIFEASIYIVPTLFLHLSFTYPVKSSSRSRFFLAPFYCAAATFIVISAIQLTKLFFFGKDITDLYYLSFHTTIADVYLILVLIITIAKFEHSALTISDITFKKQIYWALSGITFGPLIYVFLCLIPRILMGYELISLVFMQFTTVVAPIMLLISITRNRRSF